MGLCVVIHHVPSAPHVPRRVFAVILRKGHDMDLKNKDLAYIGSYTKFLWCLRAGTF